MTPDHDDAVDDLHGWDAAYVLGALSPRERREYETYLEANPAARDDMAELAGIPGLLGMLTTEEAVDTLAAPNPESTERLPVTADAPVVPLRSGTVHTNVRDLAHRVGVRRRRRRVLVAVSGVAAAIAIGLGGFALGTAGGGTAGTPSDAASSRPTAAMTAAPGVDLTADVALTPQPWGTRLDWSCSYDSAQVVDDTRYDLVVTDDDGQRTVVATWDAKGPKATDLSAATEIPAEKIRTVSITDGGGALDLASTQF